MEPLLPRSALVSPVTQMRSTILAASLTSLAANGLRPAYDRHLVPWARTAIDELVPATWVPLELAFAHYRACEALALPSARLNAVCLEAGSRLQGTVLSTVVGLARKGGATPWAPISQYARSWGRMFVGGSVATWKLGPCEARIELRGLPLLGVPYFAQAMRLLHESAYGLFCTKVAVREGHMATASGVTYRVTWT